jgi:hypothetical protein
MDRKSWIRDVVSPTNLWSMAQWASPAGTSAVSGWLSYALHFPPSVILMVALMTAASTLVLVSEIRKNSVFQKLAIKDVETIHFHYPIEGSNLSAVQLQLVYENTHPYDPIWVHTEVLGFDLQNRTSLAEILDSEMIVAPGGTHGYLLPMIIGLELGLVIGRAHLRLNYGKNPDRLNHIEEKRIIFKGVSDPNSIHFNWFAERQKR